MATRNVMRYTRVFLMNNFPPYICYFCKEEIAKFDIHHLDHNEINDVPSNLVSVCRSCHVAHHWGGREYVHSEETKQKIGDSHRGRKQSKEWIENKVAARKANGRQLTFAGKNHSEESRKKMSEAASRREERKRNAKDQ